MNLVKIHPGLLIIYYVLWIFVSFLFNNPYYLLASYVAILLLIYLQGISKEFKNCIKMVIPLAILIFIFNPILYHVGTHRIYIIGSYFITLEATFFGFLMCMTLLLILLIFTSYNQVVSYQEMLYIFSKKLPNTSMMIIMALRFIPLINNRFLEVNQISKLDSKFYLNDVNESSNNNLSFIDKIKNVSYSFAKIIGWSLEDGMITAKSMKSRAYGVEKRTNYLNFDFNKIDYIFIILISVMLLISVVGLIFGYGHLEVYPTLDLSVFNLPLNIFYLSFIIFLAPIIVLELYEKVVWYKYDYSTFSKYNSNIVNEIGTADFSNLMSKEEAKEFIHESMKGIQFNIEDNC